MEIPKHPEFQPSVSVLIPAYNEDAPRLAPWKLF